MTCKECGYDNRYNITNICAYCGEKLNVSMQQVYELAIPCDVLESAMKHLDCKDNEIIVANVRDFSTILGQSEIPYHIVSRGGYRINVIDL